MRPRHKTAENPPAGAGLAALLALASMRPRHKTAENRALHYTEQGADGGFNEAAA